MKMISSFSKNIQICLMIAGCIMFFADLKAQNIVYEYDASGNRKSRKIETTIKSMAVDTIKTVKTVMDNDDSEIDESIDEQKNDAFDVKIYPNPTSGFFEVEILPNLNAKQTAQLRIFSLTGSLVKQVDKLQSRQSVDISNLSQAIYVLHVIVDGKTIVRKIIKQ
jgi:hypothetical protein